MSPILQHNNNNNYPCHQAGGPGALPHKCSLPLPLPSRPELSLTGLPLIRGLRAWALCSRNRQRHGPPGQLPVADVQLSAEWGLPLGTGIGALVATLQTSEGSSRTQTPVTQFLRSDRGKASPHTAPQPPGGLLRGWLQSKSGPPPLPPHTGASRPRERSGMRFIS
uniref:Uncharacterized protein n=1 Tax=Knipowitschia caucasica TaxID=637954 RepID=A0AAV2J0S0_KNICA